jgi:zinc protease
MKRLSIILFFLTLTSSLLSSPLQFYKLNNGLNVILFEKENAPVVDVRVFYDVGSYIEKDGEKGLSHLFEHMMFRGSKNVGDEEHSQRIQKVGGTSNAYTSDDMTVYYQRIPSNELDLALYLESDRMQNLIINESILKKEREVVKEEYRWRYENNPQGKMFLDARKIFYPNYNYQYGAIGKLDDISAVSVDDCYNFYKKHYSPDNAILVVVGDFDSIKAKTLIESHFGSIPSKGVHKSEFKTFKRTPKQIKATILTDFPTDMTTLSFHVPPANNSRELAAIEMIGFALASSESSRLYQELVKEQKAALSVFDYLLVNRGSSLFMIGVSHQPGFSKIIQKRIWKQFKQIKKNGLTEIEFKKIKNKFLTSKTFSLYNASTLSDGLGRAYLQSGDPNSYLNELKLYESISQNDIKEAAKKYLVKKNLTYIHFKPNEKEPLDDI